MSLVRFLRSATNETFPGRVRRVLHTNGRDPAILRSGPGRGTLSG
jgi:hypothetical protein